jgi:hypothetical protein
LTLPPNNCRATKAGSFAELQSAHVSQWHKSLSHPPPLRSGAMHRTRFEGRKRNSELELAERDLRGLRTKEKAPPKGGRDQHVWVRRGTAFLLVAQGNTGFYRVAQSKTPLPAQAKKSPAEAGQGLVSLEMRKGAASASGQCAWEQSVPETSKGKAPAADGASFLPRPQILDCGSAAAFRLQPQSGSAGIVPIESPPRSGARLLGCGRESARRSNNSWRGGGPFQ